jgi:protein O-GlcNAc transferase
MRIVASWTLVVAMCGVLAAQSVREAVALANQGKTQEAIEMFETLYQRDENNPTVANWLGYLYLKTGKYAEAVPMLEKATQLTPRNAEAWNNLGNAYLHTNQLEKSINAYRKAIELKPNDADAHYNLGNPLHQNEASTRKRWSITRKQSS